MSEYVKKYTRKEGGAWLEWPFKFFKLNESELLTLDIPMIEICGSKRAMFEDADFGISIFIHSLVLSDGRKWDCVNGFRKKKENIMDEKKKIDKYVILVEHAEALNKRVSEITKRLIELEATISASSNLDEFNIREKTGPDGVFDTVHMIMVESELNIMYQNKLLDKLME